MNKENYSPRHPDRVKFLNEVPEFRRSTFKKAYTGRSRTNALKAFCLECVGFQAKEVTLCPAIRCPLWQYRPYKKGEENG